jgi:hypothetical protein
VFPSRQLTYSRPQTKFNTNTSVNPTLVQLTTVLQSLLRHMQREGGKEGKLGCLGQARCLNIDLFPRISGSFAASDTEWERERRK